MKKTGLLLILVGLILISCSSDNEPEEMEELTDIELMVQGSPWIFKEYELVNILDSGNSSLTEEDIENETSNDLVGIEINFNSDGSGISRYPGEEYENFTWAILDGNRLELDYSDGDFQDIEIYENFSVSSTELRMSVESVTFDSEVGFEVLHFGTLVFE